MCIRDRYKSAILTEESVVSRVGGFGPLDARALFLGAVYPNSHHLALKLWLVSSKAQSMIGHRASVQSAVDGASSFKRVFVFP